MSERAVKSYVMGRKNFLFHDTVKRATASAIVYTLAETAKVNGLSSALYLVDCQHFFRQIFLGYFPDIVQAFDTLGRNVYGDDYTSLHNPIVLSSVLLVYGMFHSTQILF